MDTISSRDSNTNIWPMAGIAAGVIALILAVIAFAKVSSVNSKIEEQLRPVVSRVESLEGQVGQVGAIAQTTNETKTNLYKIAQGANDSFKQVSDELAAIKGRLDKAEAGRPAVRPTTQPGAQAAGGAAQQPAVAGTDVYVVKSGDNGMAIVRATGFTLSQLEAVNPGIDWRKLKVGQKVVLPKK